MDFSKGVSFDPGYSKYTLPFAQNIDAAYNMLFSIKAPHQRKFKFQILYPQLLKLLEQTVAFYLGCLLWATFISRNFSENPKDIVDNPYIGIDVNEDDMLYEVNYSINYIDKLKKDCNYYLSKNCNIPDSWLRILSLYKEFLVINNYLVTAKTTADIKIPGLIKSTDGSDLNLILEKIKFVVNNGDLKDLFSVKDLILD